MSRVLESGIRRESYGGRSYVVRPVRGNAAGRSYVCPGCQQSLASSLEHVVVWPDDGLGDVSDRRHWHTGCWSARDRRPPQGSWH
ncbi:hypothetical protein GCM10011492_01570 [Flexivirga endophytica]|uniref:ATP/GTP-binding protein n=1 Tax=Flexivirga endophytica TaxID=1849103 RepID=A0A916STU9_9MICO|nr:hypothetical protein [Flexivirga endophytica]GGB15572.1 hypothetical protein GCM10011492_01570 [Flexivirga endophytica]GHB40013.1 hypothetical protein GCM10008112_06050 [Flexivirga endophytica]